MSEQPFQVRLETINQHLGQFTLSFHTSHYLVVLKPDATFNGWLYRLQRVLIGYNDPARQLAPQALLHNIGLWLWQALFPANAPVQIREELAQALRTGHAPLLLVLPDLLAELPWELLCDPEQPADQGFLARRRPLVRFLESNIPLSLVSPPLRVLLLISSPPSPREDMHLDVESERATIEQAAHEMRESGLLHLLVEDIVTTRRVLQALISFKPHIVHYIGHGRYDEVTGGELMWEDEVGNEFPLPAHRFAEILRQRNLLAVVLHSCQTGRDNMQKNIRGVAGMLIKEGIPVVLAQQANFTYESSQRASEAWYAALAVGQGFADALFEVRHALAQVEQPDWAVPILQGNSTSLVPLLDNVTPGPPDPGLTSPRAANNRPTPTGIFVGQHRELRALCLMLENIPDTGPVLALITGPGGVGKSTLVAQAVMRYAKQRYKATLNFSCQDYQSIELFLQRIGEFLKLQGAPGLLEQILPDSKLSTTTKIEEAIIAFNSVGPLLLIMDNLESVQNDDLMIYDGPLLYLLQKLLTNLRGGRVLITGRYKVKGLLPSGKFTPNLLRLDLDDLSPYEINQLLIRHPTFAHIGETVRGGLIEEFGGLPYVYDILSDDATSYSLDLLFHDAQRRVTKQKKRRTTEEWRKVHQQVVDFTNLEATTRHLSEGSRILLARISILRRPFPLEAIEQGLGAIREEWQPLLDWSLLYFNPWEKTYRLYNFTKHFAEKLLNESDRILTLTQLASWYEYYADHESYDLADYLEAYRFWRVTGDIQRANELVIQLVETLQRFGLSPPPYKQGIARQHQQFAVALMDAQQQLSLEEAALGKFFRCLIAFFLGELPELVSLEAPFTDLWQAFQDALNPPSVE